MDTPKDKVKKQAIKSKSTKRKEKKYKSGKVFRRKSLKSLGNFMNRILKTLGTLAHFGDVGPVDAEDDEGGFRDTTTATLSANSGNFNKEDFQGARGNALKKSATLSSHGSVKERLSWCYGDKTPGVLGLKNHGNTCFMNAVVQCLSNTDLLAEYLGLEQYKSDLCERNANGIARNEDLVSVRGEVTEQLAALVRALWTLEYTPQLSVEFKSIVSKYGSQFRGNSQHDALEFLLWLLDRVNEDANDTTTNNTKTKASALVQAGGETIPVVGPVNAHQPGTRFSFVQEHFQAQYRSSLTCPHCLKQSNTFDPFLCISLPIPLRQTRPLNVTLVFNTKGQRYLRVGLAVPLLGSVATLRSIVAEEGKITPDQVILTEVYPAGFQRSFSDDEDLSCISEGDVVYAFEAPPSYGRQGSTRAVSGYHHSLPSSPYSSGPEGPQRLLPSATKSSEFLNQGGGGGGGGGSSKLLFLICNTAGSGQQAVRFGPPFLMREERSLSWEQIQQSLLSKLYYLMLNSTQAQSGGILFRIRVVGGSASYSYLSPQDSRPFCHPAVDRALKMCGPGSPAHVKLIIEWEHKVKECLFGSIQEEVVKDAESVRATQQQHLQQHSCTLDECFQLYTKEEQLAPDDAWKCPHCQQLQQGMVKMSLWTLPNILILHLKRFRQVGERRNKLSTLVHFPAAGLDMAPHVVKRSQSTRNLANGGGGGGGGGGPAWSQPPNGTLPHDFHYDLYAVCNHHGGMHGGHYTAYCRNSVDGQWYGYDDSSVDLVPEEELCTRGAYILFYQRRNAIPQWSANSSIRGSTSSSMSDHWLIRLGESERGSVVSRSSTTYPSSIPDSPESPVFPEEPAKAERGGFESRPFVRGIQGRSVSMRSPTKTKDTLSKVLPLRWSFGSKDRRRKPTTPAPEPATFTTPPAPAELVEYLESGRRPRCTKDPIISLVSSPSSKQGPAGKQRPPPASIPSSSSSLSCVGGRGTTEEPSTPDFHRAPEGQRRQVAGDKTGSLRRSTTSMTKQQQREDGGTMDRRSSRRNKHTDQTMKNQDRRDSNGGFPLPNPSIHSSLNSSLQDSLEDTARDGSDSRDRDRDRDKGRWRRELSESKSHDAGLLSFLKGGFLKRDSMRSRSRDSEWGGRGSNVDTDSSTRSMSKLSLSNGGPGSSTAEGKNGSYNSSSTRTGRQNDELANGKVRSGDGRTSSSALLDIKRSQSSTNLPPSRSEQLLRRSASLHRNGLSSGPRSLASGGGPDTSKASCSTLGRTGRYSSTSLGRKKAVPESSF